MVAGYFRVQGVDFYCDRSYGIAPAVWDGWCVDDGCRGGIAYGGDWLCFVEEEGCKEIVHWIFVSLSLIVRLLR